MRGRASLTARASPPPLTPRVAGPDWPARARSGGIPRRGRSGGTRGGQQQRPNRQPTPQTARTAGRRRGKLVLPATEAASATGSTEREAMERGLGRRGGGGPRRHDFARDVSDDRGGAALIGSSNYFKLPFPADRQPPGTPSPRPPTPAPAGPRRTRTPGS
jgi:hypothetical protein